MTGKTHKIKMHAVAKIKNYKVFCQNVILLCLFIYLKWHMGNILECVTMSTSSRLKNTGDILGQFGQQYTDFGHI